MAAQDPIEAIHRAAINGETVGVARMLDEDPGLLSSEWGGETLLTQAAFDDDVGVVRLLLGRGADVNTPNDSGETALHLAADTGHEEIVSILLDSGADISRRGDAGWTSLIYACSSGSLAVVRLLLRAMEGRGLDERSQGGCTALWCACHRGHAAVVRALLVAGADHTLAGNDGDTPQQVAHQNSYPRCVALIKWWEGELQRAYVLHKARTLHEDAATRQQAPAAPVPAYLSPRVQGGCVMPSVEVDIRGRGGSGGPRTRAAANRGGEDEEAICAMVGYVVKDLAAELYTELLQGLHK